MNETLEVVFIPWEGLECPCSGDVLVKLRNGHIYFARKPEKLRWEYSSNLPSSIDVVGYRETSIKQTEENLNDN